MTGRVATKPLTRLNELSALEITRAIGGGRTTCEAVTRACLERIAEREPQVLAWEYLDPDQVIAQAGALDRSECSGALIGVPFGVKDIIDTFDMPTGYGSPIYAGHRPRRDAACVAMGRKAGGVAMGKTVTAEFAVNYPGKTRNPFDPDAHREARRADRPPPSPIAWCRSPWARRPRDRPSSRDLSAEYSPIARRSAMCAARVSWNRRARATRSASTRARSRTSRFTAMSWSASIQCPCRTMCRRRASGSSALRSGPGSSRTRSSCWKMRRGGSRAPARRCPTPFCLRSSKAQKKRTAWFHAASSRSISRARSNSIGKS